MNKPFDIVLMVGIPGSGKTTFCRERLFPSHLYISLDQLRTRSPDFGEGIDEIYDVNVSEKGFDVRRRNEKRSRNEASASIDARWS